MTEFDHDKQCFVLKKPKEVINAFHPDFMKTYYPDFCKELRALQVNKDQAKKQTKVIDKARAEGKSPGTIAHLGSGVTGTRLPAHVHRRPVKTMEEKFSEATARKEFHVYAKAGMPKK